MKIINMNTLSSLTASSENASYPASNLYLNATPKKKWKAANAAVTSATLTISVDGDNSGLGLVGIVADAANVTITTSTGMIWQNVDWQNVDWIAGTDGMTATITWANQPDGTASMWVDFPQFVGPVTITIELTKAATNPNVIGAGVLVVGSVIDIPGVKYPINEGIVDYSTIRQLSNGAWYHRSRDRVRTFSGEINVNRESYFYRFMRDFALAYGQGEIMALIVDNMGTEWVVYGRMNAMPSGSHYSHSRSTIQFEMIEVI